MPQEITITLDRYLELLDVGQFRSGVARVILRDGDGHIINLDLVTADREEVAAVLREAGQQIL
jgi:hypothetical protein